MHRNSSNKKQANLIKRRFRYPLIKLALNVGSLAVFHLPYTIWSGLLFFSNGCFYLQHFFLMIKTTGWTRFFLLIRIIFDAVISLSTDTEVSYSHHTILY